MASTPDEFRTGIYKNYVQLMETFLDNSVGLHQQLQIDWDNFAPVMNSALAAFPNTPDGALQNIFSAIHQFGKKFRDNIEQRKRQQEEYAKFAEMGWLGGGGDEPVQETSANSTTTEKVKVPKKLGILDQLIDGIIRGDFGLTDDNTPQFVYRDTLLSQGRPVPTKRPLLAAAASQTPSTTPHAQVQAQPQSLEMIDAILEGKDDFGFGLSYADDLDMLGGEDLQLGGEIGVDEDLDSLLGDLTGVTIDQLLG